ncbi:MAG: DpnD/PcfM family protein [Paludibacter sp.]|nr:DpnD/PcfM family protein [Paludibacter sp.]MDD4198701.1 DpnD/PcfM family protein [Paludibacter sp.]MDD4427119.1 DpnD/PcfM family protein [Paludibacter sp.]
MADKMFEIEIREVLSRVIKVESKNQTDAILKVQEMYRNEEIVLDSGDYLETDISAVINHNLVEDIIYMEEADERNKLMKVLCLIGLSEYMSNLISIEAGSSQAIVNEDYLIEIGVPVVYIDKVMHYVNMFYRGEFNSYLSQI